MRNGCLVVFALPAVRVNELASERVDWPNSVAKNKQFSVVVVPEQPATCAIAIDTTKRETEQCTQRVPVSCCPSDASCSLQAEALPIKTSC